MSDPSNSAVQNILPVQAYFNVDGSFNTFIGQGVPFVVSATESIGITDTTVNATLYPVFSPVNTGNVTSLDVTSSKYTFNPSTGVLSAPTFSGNVSGTASTATNIAGGAASQLVYQSASGVTSFIPNGTSGQYLVSNGASAPSWTSASGSTIGIADDTSSATTFYPLFSSATSGTVTTLDTSSTKLQYVPSTGTLKATLFSGSGASLTNIPNGALTNSSVTVGSTAISLGGTATTIAGLTSVTSTTFVGALTGNASTATSATTATNATNSAITDNTSSSATWYPTLSANSSGNNPLTTSSTKLSFVPSTGTLIAPNFSGLASSATNIAGGASNQIAYQTSTGTTGFITAPTTASTFLEWNGSAFVWASAGGGGMVYPGAGIPNSTGSAWGTSYSTTGTGTVVALATSPSFTTPSLGVATATSLSIGTLTYTPANALISSQSSVSTYNQIILQNSNTGTTASADFIVNNSNSTDSTYYGDFGMNSSGFTGSGAFNQANNVYLTSTTADLAIGTTTSNSIHFVINGSATDAMTINTSGAVAFNGSYGTSGQVLASAGSSSPNTWLSLPTFPSGTIVGTSDTQTLTNKRVTPRVLALSANSATPAINTDSYDFVDITNQSTAITSFTSGLSGTPTDGQKLWIAITGTTAIALTWGTSFESSTATLPTTTVSTTRLDVGFVWNTATTKWRCVAVA
jgi:hypothetical protein